MEQARLAVEVDDAGNLLGRTGDADDVWTGSHLDSVPNGGKYDGMLGVVAGLEAVERAPFGKIGPVNRVTTSFREFCTVGRWAARYGHVSVLVVARAADQVGASRRTSSDTRQSG